MSAPPLAWLPALLADLGGARSRSITHEARGIWMLLLSAVDGDGVVDAPPQTAARTVDAVAGPDASASLDELVCAGLVEDLGDGRLRLPLVARWRAACTPGAASTSERHEAPVERRGAEPGRAVKSRLYALWSKAKATTADERVAWVGAVAGERFLVREGVTRSWALDVARGTTTPTPAEVGANRSPTSTPTHSEVSANLAPSLTLSPEREEETREEVGGEVGAQDANPTRQPDAPTPAQVSPLVAPATSGATPARPPSKSSTRRKHSRVEEAVLELVPSPGTRARVLYDRVVASPVFGEKALLGARLRIQAPGAWVQGLLANPAYGALDVVACAMRALSWGEDPANQTKMRTRSGRAFVERWLDRDAAEASARGETAPTQAPAAVTVGAEDARAQSAARAAEYQRKLREAEERRKKVMEVSDG